MTSLGLLFYFVIEVTSVITEMLF